MIPFSHFNDYTRSNNQPPEVARSSNANAQAAATAKVATIQKSNENANAKAGTKRTAGSKSMNAPYQKLTPIMTDGNDETEMDVEADFSRNSEVCDVKEAILVCPQAVIIKYKE